MRDRLRESAELNHRSMNGEALEALTWYFDRREVLDEMLEAVTRFAKPRQDQAMELLAGTYLHMLGELAKDCPAAAVHVQAIKCIIDPANNRPDGHAEH
jgi:hypothetical protein